MSENDIRIRRLGPEDLAAFRALRLEALAVSGESFGSSLETESAYADAEFARMLGGSAVIAAEMAGRLVGMAGWRREAAPKIAHRGVVWGVYVAPEVRGRGVIRRLLAALVADARQTVEILTLRVVTTNTPALAAYHAAGFTVYGTEVSSMRGALGDYDQYLMVLRL